MALLAGRRHPFEEVVTFGAPRVGRGLDHGFAAKRHVRYHNRRDVVRALPFRLIGYQDHGEAVELVDPGGASWRYDHGIMYYAEILEMRAGR
jgi:hypothetical protein